MESGIADAISVRAGNIRELGVYVGFFEFMVWGALRGVEVLMLFGDHLVNLQELFGGSLAMVALEHTCRVAAVLMRPDGRMDASRGARPKVNHYVIAVPIAGVPAVAVHPKLALEAGRAGSASAAARRAGLALKITDTYGDCGIDCMTFFDGVGRSPATWSAMRNDLADYMVAHRSDPAWHDVFRVCQEAPLPEEVVSKPCKAPGAIGGMGPAVVPPFGPLISYGSSSSSSSSTGLPSSSSGLPPPLPSPAVGAPSVPPPSPPPLPPPADDPPDLPQPLLGPVADSSVAADLPGSFVAWLRARPQDELSVLAKDYQTFKQTEAKWLAEHMPLRARKNTEPKKRRNTASLVRFRLATGIAYQSWKQSAGASSASPLKDIR